MIVKIAKKLEELDVKCPHCGNKNIRGGTIKRS
jgi:ribosomal protein S27E